MAELYGKCLPSEVRKLIRAGQLRNITTDYCSGYVQLNLTMVSSSLADDFETFCKLNHGAFPLHYRSPPGIVTTGPLAKDSDVTTDLPKYRCFKDGKFTEYLTDLKSLDLSDHQSFYLGCSFTFDVALIHFSVPVRHIEQNSNIGVFRTSIPCKPVGPFKGNLLVSYRPIPLELLSKCASITDCFPGEHGAPAHIGDPSTIGIADLGTVTYGDVVPRKDGEVPVFWCCGESANDVIESSADQIKGVTVVHGPGHMFISDVKCKPYSDIVLNTIAVVEIDAVRQQYSMLATGSRNKLVQIEQMISADPGQRGIDPLRLPEDFVKACLALSHADSIMLTTGFPCHTGAANPYENDGPAGILTLMMMLLKLGKKVCLVLEQPLKEDMKNAFTSLNIQQNVPTNRLEFWNFEEYKENREKGIINFEVILASERVGPGDDGKYYTMKQRALPMDKYLEPLDEIISEGHCLTIGIGDGGNEVGMGKVRDIVKEKIKLGSQIACSISTDLLITAGVSNWGTWGLAFGLYLLAKCPVHDRYKRHALGTSLVDSVETRLRAQLPSIESETAILEAVEATGMADGICRKPMHVDGMAFEAEHSRLLKDLRDVVL